MSSSFRTFPSRPDCHCTFHGCVNWQEQAERELVNLQRSSADAITAQANIRETAEAKLAFHTKCSAENRDALQEYARSVDEENKKLRAMIDGMKESSAGLAEAMRTLEQRHQEMEMQLDEVPKTMQKAAGKEDAAGDEPMDLGGGDKTDVAVPNQSSPALPYPPPEQTNLPPTTSPAPAPKFPRIRIIV